MGGMVTVPSHGWFMDSAPKSMRRLVTPLFESKAGIISSLCCWNAQSFSSFQDVFVRYMSSMLISYDIMWYQWSQTPKKLRKKRRSTRKIPTSSKEWLRFIPDPRFLWQDRHHVFENAEFLMDESLQKWVTYELQMNFDLGNWDKTSHRNGGVCGFKYPKKWWEQDSYIRY